jgi:hypothetical protein
MVTLDIRQVGQENKVLEIGNGSVFIEMGKYTYYFDDSTGEQIMERWLTNTDEDYSETAVVWKNTMDVVSSDELTPTV